MSVFFENERAVLHLGDVRAVLRGMAAESVHTVVTSPPYWSLRDYNLPPTLWLAPDSDPDCEHEWGEWHESHDEREATVSGKSRTTERCYGAPSRKFNGNHQKHIEGAFCRRCGAWRGSLGLEPDFRMFVDHIVDVFAEVWRVLRKDGTLWINMGDSYSCSPNGHSAAATKAAGNDDRTFRDKPDVRHRGGPGNGGEFLADKPMSTMGDGLKEKDLIGQPWEVALALRRSGWYLRSDCIWYKRSAMPCSVEDRPGTDHEYVFLFSKGPRYFYDAFAVRQRATQQSRSAATFKRNGHARNEAIPGQAVAQHRPDRSDTEPAEWRGLRTVWDILPEKLSEAHYAAFPQALPRRCILAGSSEYGVCARCGAPWKRITRKSGGNIGKSWLPHGKDLETGTSACFRAGPNVVRQPDTAPTLLEIEPEEETEEYKGKWAETDEQSASRRMLKSLKAARAAGGAHDNPYTVEHIGWARTCRCKTEERTPATVLDIFSGSGTTVKVAVELGRIGWGIDLSEKYNRIAKKRVLGATPPIPELAAALEDAS